MAIAWKITAVTMKPAERFTNPICLNIPTLGDSYYPSFRALKPEATPFLCGGSTSGEQEEPRPPPQVKPPGNISEEEERRADEEAACLIDKIAAILRGDLRSEFQMLRARVMKETSREEQVRLYAKVLRAPKRALRIGSHMQE